MANPGRPLNGGMSSVVGPEIDGPVAQPGRAPGSRPAGPRRWALGLQMMGEEGETRRSGVRIPAGPPHNNMILITVIVFSSLFRVC